eukprot:4483966-Lingulodinium_polyedra.AAC.1
MVQRFSVPRSLKSRPSATSGRRNTDKAALAWETNRNSTQKLLAAGPGVHLASCVARGGSP